MEAPHYTAVPPLVGCALLAASLISGRLRGRPASGLAPKLARAGMALVVAGWLLYLASFVALDYSLAEVARNTDDGMGLLLRVGASWAGGGGSLYLLASMYAAISALTLSWGSRRVVELASAITLLLTLSAAASGAFEASHASGGLGLNPLLRSPWVVPHPLLTFSGYALLLAASTLAIGGAAGGGEAHRGLLLVGWSLVSAGMLLGGMWSYETLGWGGYWAWDPVEVSELLVWLTATAAIHVRGALAWLRRPLLVLIASSVFLAVYVTRSGLSPLHGFAGSNLASLAFLASALALLILSLTLVSTSAPSRLVRASGGKLRWVQVEQLFDVAVGASFAVMAVFVYASLLSPALAAALGREPRFPSMEDGVRFYHRVLYPLFLAALALMPAGLSVGRADSKVIAVYLASTAALASLAAVAVAAGTYRPLPHAPDGTNYKVAVGLAFASSALAWSLVYTLYHVLWNLSVSSLWAALRGALHASMTLAFIGVLVSGIYAFGTDYFQQYTLSPGEPLELPGLRIEMLDYRFEVIDGHIDMRGHVTADTLAGYAAMLGVDALKQDFIPALLAAERFRRELAGNETLRLVWELLLLANSTGYQALGPLNATGSLYRVSLDGGRVKLVDNDEIVIAAENVTLVPIVSPSHGEGDVAASVALVAANLTISARGAEGPLDPHYHLEVYFDRSLKISIGNVTVEAERLDIYPLAAAGGSQGWRQGLLIPQAVAYVESGSLASAELGNIGLPATAPWGLYLNLSLASGNMPILASYLEDEAAAGLLLEGLEELQGSGFTMPASAPAGVVLIAKVNITVDGKTWVEETAIPFYANGELMGVHGLVQPVMTIRRGLGDVYVAVQLPSVEGFFDIYHEALIYYVRILWWQLPPGEALLATAAVAAGYKSSELTGSASVEDAALTVEGAILDLVLLARGVDNGTHGIGGEGLVLMVKMVPGVHLLWMGGFAMSSLAFAMGAASLASTRRHGLAPLAKPNPNGTRPRLRYSWNGNP